MVAARLVLDRHSEERPDWLPAWIWIGVGQSWQRRGCRSRGRWRRCWGAPSTPRGGATPATAFLSATVTAAAAAAAAAGRAVVRCQRYLAVVRRTGHPGPLGVDRDPHGAEGAERQVGLRERRPDPGQAGRRKGERTQLPVAFVAAAVGGRRVRPRVDDQVDVVLAGRGGLRTRRGPSRRAAGVSSHGTEKTETKTTRHQSQVFWIFFGPQGQVFITLVISEATT